MKFTILASTMDLWGGWNIKILLNGKEYRYQVTADVYSRAMEQYKHRNFGKALNILKET